MEDENVTQSNSIKSEDDPTDIPEILDSESLKNQDKDTDYKSDNSANSDVSDNSDEENDDGSDEDDSNDDSGESSSDDETGSESDDGSDEGQSSITPSTQNNPEHEGMSSYELLRLERIRRNKAKLAQLGLDSSDGKKGSSFSSLLSPLGEEEKKKKKRRKLSEIHSPAPIKKSRRERKSVDYSENKSIFRTPKKNNTPSHPKIKSKKRIPRFVYDEFARMKRERIANVKNAERDKREAERELRFARKYYKTHKAQQERVERERKKVESDKIKSLLGTIQERKPELIAINGLVETQLYGRNEGKSNEYRRVNQLIINTPELLKQRQKKLLQILMEDYKTLKTPFKQLRGMKIMDLSAQSKPKPSNKALEKESVGKASEVIPESAVNGKSIILKISLRASDDPPKILTPESEVIPESAGGGNSISLKISLRASDDPPKILTPIEAFNDPRPAKFMRSVGGPIDPSYTSKINRSWLEIDNATPPSPENMFVPQVGDTVLYYPTGHKLFLEENAKVFAKVNKNRYREPLWKKFDWGDEFFHQNLGDYPILCKVKYTYAEFHPSVPHEKKKGKKKISADTSAHIDSVDDFPLCLCVVLKPLTSAPVPKKIPKPPLSPGETNKIQSPPKVYPQRSTKIEKPPAPPSRRGKKGTKNKEENAFRVLIFPSNHSSFIVPFVWVYNYFNNLSLGNYVRFQNIGCGDNQKKELITGRILSISKDENVEPIFQPGTRRKSIPTEDLMLIQKTKKNSKDIIVGGGSNVTLSNPSSNSQLENWPKWKSITVKAVGKNEVEFKVSPWDLIVIDEEENQDDSVIKTRYAGKSRTKLSSELTESYVYTMDEFIRLRVEEALNALSRKEIYKVFAKRVTKAIEPYYNAIVPLPMYIDKILKRLKPAPNSGDDGPCYYRNTSSLMSDINELINNCALYNTAKSLIVGDAVQFGQDVKDVIAEAERDLKTIQKKKAKSLKEGGKPSAVRSTRPIIWDWVYLASTENLPVSSSPKDVIDQDKDELFHRNPNTGSDEMKILQHSLSNNNSRKPEVEVVPFKEPEIVKSDSRHDKLKNDLNKVMYQEPEIEASKNKVENNQNNQPFGGSQNESNINGYSKSEKRQGILCEKEEALAHKKKTYISPKLDVEESSDSTPNNLLKHSSKTSTCDEVHHPKCSAPDKAEKNVIDFSNDFNSLNETPNPIKEDIKQLGLQKSKKKFQQWIPQSGDQFFYNPTLHQKFIAYHENSLSKAQRKLPTFVNGIPNHWIFGNVLKVRYVLPEFSEEAPFSFHESSPIVALHVRFDIDTSKIYLIHWRPCHLGIRSVFEQEQCKEINKHDTCMCGLNFTKSFIHPMWIQDHRSPFNGANVSYDRTINPSLEKRILKCLEILRTKCLSDIAPDFIDAQAVIENIVSRPKSHSTILLDNPKEADILSAMCFTPFHEKTQNLLSPGMCLDTIFKRIQNGYYRHKNAIIDDIYSTFTNCALNIMKNRTDKIISELEIGLEDEKRNLVRPMNEFAQQSMPLASSSNPVVFPKAQAQNVPLDKKIMQKAIRRKSAQKLAAKDIEIKDRIERLWKLFSMVLLSVESTDDLEILLAIREPPFKPDTSREENIKNYVRVTSRLLEAISKDSVNYHPVITGTNPNPTVKVKIAVQNTTDFTEPILIEPNVYEGDETLVKSLFGTKFRRNACVRCCSTNRDTLYCRIRKGHSNPDFDLIQFSNRGGIEELLRTLKSHTPHHQTDDSQIGIQKDNAMSTSERDAHLSTETTKNCEGDLTAPNDKISTTYIETGDGSKDNSAKEIISEKENTQASTNSDKESDPLITNPQNTDIPRVEMQDVVSIPNENEMLPVGSPGERIENDVNSEKSVLSFQDKSPEQIFKMAEYAVLLAEMGVTVSKSEMNSPVELSEKFIRETFPIDENDGHYEFCIICGVGGDVLCCEGCPSVAHKSCVDLDNVPEGDWFCSYCTYNRKYFGRNECTESEKEVEEPMDCELQGSDRDEIVRNNIIEQQESVLEESTGASGINRIDTNHKQPDLSTSNLEKNDQVPMKASCVITDNQDEEKSPMSNKSTKSDTASVNNEPTDKYRENNINRQGLLRRDDENTNDTKNTDLNERDLNNISEKDHFKTEKQDEDAELRRNTMNETEDVPSQKGETPESWELGKNDPELLLKATSFLDLIEEIRAFRKRHSESEPEPAPVHKTVPVQAEVEKVNDVDPKVESNGEDSKVANVASSKDTESQVADEATNMDAQELGKVDKTLKKTEPEESSSEDEEINVTVRIGTKLCKGFEQGEFNGVVKRTPTKRNRYYKVRYDDGDEEDMSDNEIQVCARAYVVRLRKLRKQRKIAKKMKKVEDRKKAEARKKGGASDQVEISTPKRRRGRPRKDEINKEAVASLSTSNSMKKARGRPKKDSGDVGGKKSSKKKGKQRIPADNKVKKPMSPAGRKRKNSQQNVPSVKKRKIGKASRK